VARPHLVAWAGQEVTLDGSRSWHRQGPAAIRDYRWRPGADRELSGPRVNVRYERPGHYSEVLRITDEDGRCAYDVAVVQVFDPAQPLPVPPAIHVACRPTTGIRVGDQVIFLVRSFGLRPDEGEELWDFGDGSPERCTRSDGNAVTHAPDGYASTRHAYRRAGDYIVTVRRSNDAGQTATGRLWLRVK
jgi:hypothetical protein